MLLTAKKAPGSSLPSPDRRESPCPDYFVILLFCFFFSLRISMFLFPKETWISPLEPGMVTGNLAHRLHRGRLFFPFWKGKGKREIQNGGETSPGSAPSRGRGAGLALPSSEPLRPASSHADASPGPRRPAPHDRWKNGTRKRDFLMGKPVLMLNYQWTEDGLFEPLTNKSKLLLFIVRVSG